MLLFELLHGLLLSISYVSISENIDGYTLEIILEYAGRALSSKACNKTCLNGGQCYIDETRGGRAQCSCPNEYYGSRCELGQFGFLIFIKI